MVHCLWCYFFTIFQNSAQSYNPLLVLDLNSLFAWPYFSFYYDENYVILLLSINVLVLMLLVRKLWIGHLFPLQLDHRLQVVYLWGMRFTIIF